MQYEDSTHLIQVVRTEAIQTGSYTVTVCTVRQNKPAQCDNLTRCALTYTWQQEVTLHRDGLPYHFAASYANRQLVHLQHTWVNWPAHSLASRCSSSSLSVRPPRLSTLESVLGFSECTHTDNDHTWQDVVAILHSPNCSLQFIREVREVVQTWGVVTAYHHWWCVPPMNLFQSSK